MTAPAKRKLGKGLGSIISVSPMPAAEIERAILDTKETIHEIDVSSVTPNPDQPRRNFDEDSIRGLAESIKTAGLIEPVILRPSAGGYSIVAGERRFRAVKMLGLKTIRAVIMELDEEKNYTVALIENIQRENLDPVEEARAYRMLTEKFGLKQQEIAERVGKERASVANSMRLLALPDDILAALSAKDISTGHAKVLLSAPAEMQRSLCASVIEKGLSVRALEEEVRRMKEEKVPAEKKIRQPKIKEAHIREMETRLKEVLATKVEIKHSGKKGKIEISYFDLDDFDRIMEIISR